MKKRFEEMLDHNGIDIGTGAEQLDKLKKNLENISGT